MRMTDKEDKIGFKLSHYYQHCKEKILGRTILHYWFWCLYSFVSSAAIYFIPQYAFNEATAGHGKFDGIYASTFVSVAIMVIVHHGIMCIGTRNWTWWMVGWYFLSFFLYFPVTVYLYNISRSSGAYRGTFKELMRSAPFWLSLVFTCSVILLPYYIVHVVWYRVLYIKFLPNKV